MTLPRKNRRWTPTEVITLFEMIADCAKRGVRNEWRKIAAATGHNESSCVLKFHADKGRADDIMARAAAERSIVFMKAPAARNVPLKARVENPPFGQTTSTAKLVLDRELRTRIAVLGITGGLFGDPEPGRSALDKRRSAGATS